MYLYNDKPDTEVAINIYDSFDSIEECNDYIEKNQDNVICNLLNLTNYKSVRLRTIRVLDYQPVKTHCEKNNILFENIN